MHDYWFAIAQDIQRWSKALRNKGWTLQESTFPYPYSQFAFPGITPVNCTKTQKKLVHDVLSVTGFQPKWVNGSYRVWPSGWIVEDAGKMRFGHEIPCPLSKLIEGIALLREREFN